MYPIGNNDFINVPLLVIIPDAGDTFTARSKKEPIPSDSHYRRPLEGPDLSGVPLGHAFELMQRDQIPLPARSLGNLALHLRHCPELGDIA
jgi:hypothetical protein